ncbi:GntR family transcriptional regulator [Ochrobactrum sp. EDr1-4]|uniref:GntR family transcriptional regulator n=1 Tax=Ochrobactrum sp. EDr1-4 TaxID=3368622 RepID=UPI003B9F7523
MAGKQISRESLSLQLYNNLRNSLMDGQYAPGQRLTISGIAEEFGTSITPVREAIFRLVSERALDVRAATSVQVPDLNFASLREVQAIRMQLEGHAASVAALNITPAQLRELKSLNANFIKAVKSSPTKASNLNRDFHFAVMSYSNMPIVVNICENMWVLMGPFLRLFHDRIPVRDLSSEDHKHFEIIAALEARDDARSRRAMEDDIRWGLDLIEQLEQEMSSVNAEA